MTTDPKPCRAKTQVVARQSYYTTVSHDLKKKKNSRGAEIEFTDRSNSANNTTSSSNQNLMQRALPSHPTQPANPKPQLLPHLLHDDLLEREEPVDRLSLVGVVGHQLANLHVGPAAGVVKKGCYPAVPVP